MCCSFFRLTLATSRPGTVEHPSSLRYTSFIHTSNRAFQATLSKLSIACLLLSLTPLDQVNLHLLSFVHPWVHWRRSIIEKTSGQNRSTICKYPPSLVSSFVADQYYCHIWRYLMVIVAPNHLCFVFWYNVFVTNISSGRLFVITVFLFNFFHSVTHHFTRLLINWSILNGYCEFMRTESWA